MTERLWITPPQFASEMGVGVKKVHEWIGSGELKAVNVARNKRGRPQYKISRDSIAAFEQSRQPVTARVTKSDAVKSLRIRRAANIPASNRLLSFDELAARRQRA